MAKKPITRREMLAYANFVAPAFGREAPDVPKPRAKSRDLEHKEQVAVIQWWHLAHKRYELPEFALFAIPNGGHRHMLTAVRLKAEGVRPAIPDLMLAARVGDYGGLFIEMKSTEGVERGDQKEVRNYLNGQKFHSLVCYGADEAIESIKFYLGK